MPSTFSSLKIELIATGEQSGTWGVTTNTNLGTAIEEAITGSADVTFTNGNDTTITLTDTNAAQAARNLRLNLVGSSTGAQNLILGSGCQIEKLYLINNTLGHTITVKNTTGTGIAVPAGKKAVVYNDGTNVVNAIDYFATADIAGGTINNTTIGGTTPAAGTFTQVNVTGQGDLRLEDTTGGEYVALQAPGTLASSYTLTLPVDDGTNGQALITDGNGNLSWSTAASGDVYGPASATDNAVVRFDSTTGKLIKNSGVIIDNSNNVTGVADFTNTGNTTLGNASGDTLTITGTTVTTPNGLNFDSNTFVIDATNNRVGVGTASPAHSVDVTGNTRVTGTAYFTDTNNWIASTSSNMAYRTGGDQLFYTGGFNERMRITSAGNVGIGTSSPGARLSAYGGQYTFQNTGTLNGPILGPKSPIIQIIGDSANNENSPGNLQIITPGIGATNQTRGAEIYLAGTRATNTQLAAATYSALQADDAIGALLFSGDNGVNIRSVGAAIRASTSGIWSSTSLPTYLIFSTTPSGSATNLERMRITSNGDVGIGTAIPVSRLHVGASGADSVITNERVSGATVKQYAAASAGSIGTETNHSFQFFTNNTTRATIDTSGNLGLGATPSAWHPATNAFQIGAFGSFLTGRTNTRGTELGSNAFRDSAGNTWTYTTSAAATYYDQNASANGQHRWFTAPSGTAGNAITFTQAMTLDASGNLQLGTTTAVTSNGTNLNIYGASASNLSLQNATSGTGNANGFQLIQDGLDTYVYNRENGAMLFATNNAERMRINSGGDVAIGTTAATGKLTVAATYAAPSYVGNGNLVLATTGSRTVDAGGTIQFGGVYTGSTYSGFAAIKGALEGAVNAGYMAFYTEPNTGELTERMRIDSSGNVGIGTSSPVNIGGAKILTIYDTTEPRIQLQNSTTGTTSSDGSNIAVAGSDLYITNREAAGNLFFFTSAAERMRITSGGEVIVGGTTATLTAAGRGNVIANGSSSSIFQLNVGNANQGYFYHDSVSMQVWNVANSAMLFATNNTERMRITSTGTVLIGTASPPATNNNFAMVSCFSGDPKILFYSNNSASQAATCGIALNTYGAAKFAGLALSSNGPGIYTTSSSASSVFLASRADSIIFGSLSNNPFENTSSTYTEQMRIDSNGDVLIGTTTSGAGVGVRCKLTVDAGTIDGPIAKVSGGAGFVPYTAWNTSTSGDNFFHVFRTEGGAGTTRGTIDYNRGAGLTRYNTTSDATLKNVIGDSDGQKSVDILKSTRIREYAWKDDAEQKPQVGVIAQELYETYKGAVSVGGEDAEGNYRPWAVDKTAFTFHLIAGWQAHEKLIQEQQAMIEELKQEVAKLKGV